MSPVKRSLFRVALFWSVFALFGYLLYKFTFWLVNLVPGVSVHLPFIYFIVGMAIFCHFNITKKVSKKS